MSPRRLKNVTLLAAIVLSGLTLLTWTGEWFSLTLRESATGHPVLSVTGDVAAPALIALALASLALVAALAMSGPLFRVVLGVLQVVIGFTVALSAILAVSNPVHASEAAISAVTGVGGSKSIAALVTAVSQSAYPVIAIAVGILTAVLGVVVLVTGRRWPGSSGRYRQPVVLEDPEAGSGGDDSEPEDAAAHAVSDWDTLSGGSDPTSR
ncbi:Trp biosynthesis-associated membrane protein [Glaciihabitans sp. INWT7]|uniref:Trp biosynthesis-associated membrane protein n=1 Tax=Glaciihabitans sp. INWT7 TaxID=2596912 RepID=UPI00162A783B|nr:Trp biosynthesis-associated membrane protein [Glaciihabitans sp. INWT7]QNE46861.1 Trp biosynthesis-associated membrane protein [Glaciihabitans sp. INWT7]